MSYRTHDWVPLPNQQEGAAHWKRCRRCSVRIAESDRKSAHSFEGTRPLGTCDEEVARGVMRM